MTIDRRIRLTTTMFLMIALGWFLGLMTPHSQAVSPYRAAHHPRLHMTAGVPPFWGKQAPSWCLEDMPCWIGSQADGRTAQAAYADWRKAMKVEPGDGLVGVMLTHGDSDGDPLEVARGAISNVHHCTGRGYARECRASLDGYAHMVRVAGVDFPHAR